MADAAPTADQASLSLCVKLTPPARLASESLSCVAAGLSVAMMPPSAGSAICELAVAELTLLSHPKPASK